MKKLRNQVIFAFYSLLFSCCGIIPYSIFLIVRVPNLRSHLKKFLDYFQWVYLWGLSLDSSVFNRNLPLKSKIINLTHQRFGFRVLYSCILSICLDNYQLRPASKSYQRWKETRKCKMTSVS